MHEQEQFYLLGHEQRRRLGLRQWRADDQVGHWQLWAVWRRCVHGGDQIAIIADCVVDERLAVPRRSVDGVLWEPDIVSTSSLLKRGGSVERGTIAGNDSLDPNGGLPPGTEAPGSARGAPAPWPCSGICAAH